MLTVHSRKCLPIAAAVLPRMRCEFTPFGINRDAYPLREPRAARTDPIKVLVAGNDPTRDWTTTLAAMGGDERFEVLAWTRNLGPDDMIAFPNITLAEPANMSAILDLYRDADVVVVPMTENIYSGITVALEAAAQGRPIVCSDTGGVPSYFGEDEVTYVEPENAAALRAGVLSAATADGLAKARAAQRRYVDADYTTKNMIERYVEYTRQCLGPADRSLK